MLAKPWVKRLGYTLLSYSLILLVWQGLTLYFPPLVVPPISAVASTLGEILASSKLQSMIVLTTQRLLIGLSIGVVIGLITGIAMGLRPFFKGVLSPIIHLFQTVPPVAWVVLALVWFGFNSKPVVFIVVTTTAPIIAINVCQGILSMDKSLLQMAQLYCFSQRKTFFHVVLPSITPYFRSAFELALGSGWKIAVMGEVLTTSDGIGGMIKTARLNVEPESVIAWSVVIVVLFHLSDWLMKLRLPRKRGKPC
ncbi:ABC transporter permease [Bengtsoniella intestinalis]|uniref:ABC transporter permease n=1 Tax=Bengtsoniella intestinalis TaxID=3073143 RepID=UPI00391F6D0D